MLGAASTEAEGMWQRTYERMRWRHLEAEQRIDEAFNERAISLIAQW
jgi:hypothetical protein